MPHKKPYEPIDPNPVAHLMPSERFTPPDRPDLREMTVIDSKTGEEVLMLKRGFGEMAVWKTADEWAAESKARWEKFYKEHPTPAPRREYGTYLGDFDGHGNYPPGSGSSYTPAVSQKPVKREYREDKKTFVQALLETILVIFAIAMPIMAVIADYYSKK